MLSPKMQRSVRVNDTQLLMLAERAQYDHSMHGLLQKRSSDNHKWQLRWFILYQNLLFYYEAETSNRPSGLIFLEGSYCERLIAPNCIASAGIASPAHKVNKEEKLQESFINYVTPEEQVTRDLRFAHKLKLHCATSFLTLRGRGGEKIPFLRHHCFSISYRRENQRQYDLKAANESECATWILAIREASFNKLLLQKEELEQKHVHLLQVVESEKTAKWQYTQQCEELASEIKKLRAEICSLRREYSHRPSLSQTPVGRGSFSAGSVNADDNCSLSGFSDQVQDTAELRKIKKVQSFFRGWLCRRRWKQIVEEYIKSPHAESMRKRNSLVFSMVEAEEEYMEQLEVLVSCFYRPFKMAASSKKPPCSHEDVNSIFLNCETVLFLHQIFLKGLTSRLESWPTLVLGDLFDMLLPMLSIYQEYVRNHHYSLQVLTECKVNNTAFAAVLKRLEAKSVCQGRCIETFLTYPMHQIPRYIITLHELLAHTPHDHVERKSLQNARQQLEDLSRQMHDEVSETENLRKNLSVERMIVEGCDILLDVNQVFVRQGTLVQVPPGKGRIRSRLTFKSERESVRQCFLFSNNMIIATRTSGGRLHLLPDVGKILLADATLIEDPSSDSEKDEEDADILSQRTRGSTFSVNESVVSTSNRDFKILVDLKSGVRHCIHLVASTVQEKEAWISDISQCMDNIHLHSMLSPGLVGSSGGSIAAHHALKTDPRLFKDDVDIRFSRTLNSCKLPQVRYATPERLLQRLTDLRFLSIDFLNTFLLTYRVFTDSETVLNALKKVFYDPSNEEHCDCEPQTDFLDIPGGDDGQYSPRRTSGASSVSGYCSEGPDRDRSLSQDSTSLKPKGKRILTNQSTEEGLSWIPEMCGPTIIKETDDSETNEPKSYELNTTTIEVTAVTSKSENLLCIPSTTIATSKSLDTLTESIVSDPSSPSNLSSVTLVGSTGSESSERTDSITTELSSSTATTTITSSTIDEIKQFKYGTVPTGPLPERIRPKVITTKELDSSKNVILTQSLPPTVTTTHYTESGISTVSQEPQSKPVDDEPRPKSRSASTVSSLQPHKTLLDRRPSAGANIQIPHAALCQHRHSLQLNGDSGLPRGGIERSSPRSFHRILKTPEKTRKHLFGTPQKEPPRRFSESDDDMSSSLYTTPRGSLGGSSLSTMSPRASIQQEPINHCSSKVGVVITSYRQSHRSLDPDALWSSTSTAAQAFAIATSGSSNPRDEPPELRSANRKESVVSSPATMRVLNVLRHWVSKHFQDFEQDVNLRSQAIVFLEDITCSPNLLPSEHRAASQLLRLLVRDDLDSGRQQLEALLTQPLTASKDSIETLSALEIAEQMTYLDHQIFMNIRSEEFLGQSWMKSNKKTRAEHIIQMTKRFNDGSRLVSSEIISRSNISYRVAAIEKWTAVADICRCLHNFNGVLQVCAAFTNAAVFRLKKTWDKVPKTIKHTITKLQAVICSDGRFRAMREALHRCDPPCIPYLGMYLTDLSFIEEGTPDFTQDRLLNFSKMRMVAHVIREIRHFQQTPYKIDHIPRVTAYLLDSSLLLDDEELYSRSLQIEPRSSRLSAPNTQLV